MRYVIFDQKSSVYDNLSQQVNFLSLFEKDPQNMDSSL